MNQSGNRCASRQFPWRRQPSFSRTVGGIKSYEKTKSLRKGSLDGEHTRSNRPKSSPKKKVVDPQEPFLLVWNKMFVISCMISIFLDPLFFYAPVVDAKNLCLSLDQKLEIAACVLRSFFDIVYVFHIVLQFRTGFIVPSSRIYGRGELVEDLGEICRRYLSSYFIIDIFNSSSSVVISIANAPTSPATKDFLKMVIFAQYIPRFYRIYPLSKEIMRTSGAVIAETAWPAAAYYLLQCILASHVLGALWYLVAIERKERCWQMACGDHNGCKLDDLYCGVGRGDTSFLNSSCPLLEPNEIKSPADFDFGMFLDAHKSHVVEQTDFTRKILQLLLVGLAKFENLNTSNSVGEIIFALVISITGLVLVASVISSSIQQFVQSVAGRLEEVRMKRRDIEQWMSHRMLPEDLRLVPIFEKMDEQLLDAMCSCLKPILYTDKSFIYHEGDPVDEMLFIMKGNILTNDNKWRRNQFFNSVLFPAVEDMGAYFIQATWRRHYKRKIEKLLQEAEDTLQNPLSKEGSGSLPSLAATVYASRFATNMLGNLRRNHPHLQKPAEPDFSAENPS
ncbi:Cyclic nucleotide-gated ion channel 1 [Sesamum angolense]|uniref:Cyclic nucleotide-gated ion channel 1 n=1 Tax=Sesamum angolense TaxID=2727404 RepID=A0AAE1WQ66_9LAMI|nr:Cyclic nucleotide-gated ion channel 1 [Sesamum angolense]